MTVGVAVKVLERGKHFTFDERKSLGTGSFGTVFDGSMINPGAAQPVRIAFKQFRVGDTRPVANPVFKGPASPSHSGSTEAKQTPVKDHFALIKREAELLWQVKDCGSFVQLHGWCREPLGLVTEFCDGGSLDEQLYLEGSNAPTPVEAAPLVRDLLSGVRLLHQLGIVHRDLKSPNLLLHQGRLKLADFGSARRMVSGTARATRDTDIGTCLWSPPEKPTKPGRLFGKGTRRDPARDVWSVGCIIGELYLCRLPFLDAGIDPQHANKAKVTKAKKERKPPHDPVLLAKISPRLAAFVAKLCDYDPAKRPTLATAVREWNAVEEEILKLHAPPVSTRSGRVLIDGCRKRRW